MAKLEIQIHENTSATKDVAPYLGTFVSKGTINFAALAKQVAKLSGLPVIQVEAILRGAFDEFGDLERGGPVRINFDGGCICVIIKGRFESSDAAFDPEKNSLEIAWHLSDNIRNSLVNEVPRIVTDETTTKVRLDNVADVETPRPYQVIHGTKPFRCTGINLVTTDAGAEVYLEDALGVKYPCTVDEVVSRQEFTAHVASPVEAGDYKLIVKSRGGDAEGQLQTAFRKVKYLEVVIGEPKITSLICNGHETDVDKLFDGCAIVIHGSGFTGFKDVTFEFNDSNGGVKSYTVDKTELKANNDQQLAITGTATLANMRAVCEKIGAELATEYPTTLKVTFADDTVLSHEIAFGA
jgi:hypothetical protein